MAFGAVAGVFIFFTALIIGCVGIDISVAGIVLSSIAKSKGKKFGKPLMAVSIVVLVISFVITTIVSVFYIRARIAIEYPTEEFPETDIIIEEIGYQEDTFTVDDVVYERVEIDNLRVIGGEELSGPIFSYKDSYFFIDKWGTYDKLENEHGFNLVVGKADDVFCPVDEKEDVTSFYSDDDNYEWYFDYNNYYNDLDDECQKALNELLETRRSKSKTVRINTIGYNEYYFEQLSKDDLFFKDKITIFAQNGEYYLEVSPTEFWGDGKNPGSEVVKIEKDTGELLTGEFE